jgi:hypothetical protein
MKIIALSFLLLVFKFKFFFIYNIFPLRFFRNFIDFQFHHSIQIYGIIFFNLILTILIFNFSLAFKFYLFSILSFNPNLWYIIFTNLVLILFYFFPFVKFFFFSISPFNQKIIINFYINFDPHSFNPYFVLNHFV